MDDEVRHIESNRSGDDVRIGEASERLRVTSEVTPEVPTQPGSAVRSGVSTR
jgi:hypothetical protein